LSRPFKRAQPEQQRSLGEHRKIPACKGRSLLGVIYANSKGFSHLK